jgi:hypothetical protein
MCQNDRADQPSPQSTPSHRMACQGNRLSPVPFRLARILLPAPFPSGADTAARVFAAAVVKPAGLRREQRL